jgi:hypothetical protein
MKQIVALFAIVVLASCGNGTSTTEVKSTDSTEVKSTDSTVTEYLGVVDTTAVDTTKVETK